ncbi:hypothetical protein BpHYR1_012155 [Brachionus plicatilis]|uniref:MULE transposase domain-containing protein n=1 Tax=Brachionus plicatilis TaxID=10195 RepID=A0A3M7SCL8_BRAPC|nr:hypothetical protein BpHYR1_012155 [Brachionus plicatilis]
MAVNELVNDFNNLNIQIGTVTMSQQDCPQLFINVFFFRVYSSDADGEVIGKEYTVKFTHEIHNHCPNHKRFELMEKRRKIKESTKAIAKITPKVSPRQIITKFNEEVRSKEAVAFMATYDADRQAVNRYKKQVQPEYPPEPKKLSDIVIPDFLKLTLSDQDFLLYDSGEIDDERFFIFSTTDNLKLIENSQIFADGTFSIAPRLFHQVYTIHGLVHGRCVPLIYCLLPRKTEQIYVKVLNVIVADNSSTVISPYLSAPPLSITSDFERAFINACESTFESSLIYGCFFHFKQAVWRKIQEFGLCVPYEKLIEYRKILKVPQVLAFVPPNDVNVLFNKIKASLDKNLEYYSNVVKLFEYLEETWIGRDVVKKTGRGRWTKTEIVHVKPMFEIELWNINSRINDCLPRTNNFVEAWHNAFSGMLCKHPSVYPLVDKFRYEQKKSEDLVVQLLRPKS